MMKKLDSLTFSQEVIFGALIVIFVAVVSSLIFHQMNQRAMASAYRGECVRVGNTVELCRAAAIKYMAAR
ncbi:hypothetical protein [Glaciimonas immobilis]|uniref:Uncharacterized protein n=1 Tax=Glaciimonas immobilis TaxID=728004 RepID=A0A840RWJ1_9BURK|nr:hypothetical protein [Glaciimonas immobilis]KAF3997527.1 hypothetical protein HAV38_12675 [Glaciimonas immobilis]MBB5200789.1 hypothetical protein [Glaciimonas immobilis]